MIKGHKYGKDQCTDENFEKEAIELYGCTTPFGPNKDRICDDTENATKGSVALLSHFTSSEVRFLNLVFLHGDGCPGALDPRGRDSLGNQHHAEKLSPKIALHLK